MALCPQPLGQDKTLPSETNVSTENPQTQPNSGFSGGGEERAVMGEYHCLKAVAGLYSEELWNLWPEG